MGEQNMDYKRPDSMGAPVPAKELANEAAGVQDQSGQQAEGSIVTRLQEVVTEETVKAAQTRCTKYWQNNKGLEQRLIENETYYRQQCYQLKDRDERQSLPERGSAYLLNAIINKTSDAMDNFPQPTIIPREQSDEKTANILSKVIPVILERNNYTKTYYECALEKMKNGFSVTGVFWNPTTDNIGEVEVRRIEPLNMRWQPGIKNIQDSKEVFVLSEYDAETLQKMYPKLTFRGGVVSGELSHYDDAELTRDTENKCIVYDWYYKVTRPRVVAGQVFPVTTLQYCKFCEGQVLYASENDPAMRDRGWYDKPDYPFVFDVLYPVKDTPYGFGLIDMMRDPQEYIDKLDHAIMLNALANSRPRWFVKENSNVSEEEYADFNKLFITYAGDPTAIIPVQASTLASIYVQVLEDKKEELKENAGNRDFSQGSTSGSVTAASAIAALQEASSKTSRMSNRVSYESFKEVVNMVISRVTQFYTVPRTFRIIDNNEVQYRTIGIGRNPMMNTPEQTDLVPGSVYDESLGEYVGGRVPVYDISVGAEKASPYSRISQNELAKELYTEGVFNPQLADQVMPMLKMMDFDGKEDVMQSVAKNQQMMQTIQVLQQRLQQMAGIISSATGDTRLEDALSGQQVGTGEEITTPPSTPEESAGSQAEQMASETRNRAAVGGGQ